MSRTTGSVLPDRSLWPTDQNARQQRCPRKGPHMVVTSLFANIDDRLVFAPITAQIEEAAYLPKFVRRYPAIDLEPLQNNHDPLKRYRSQRLRSCRFPG